MAPQQHQQAPQESGREPQEAPQPGTREHQEAVPQRAMREPREVPQRSMCEHHEAPQRAMRADAARNRAAIIEAATAVLAEQGSTVDVREIARRSGVGMGTLYRHFPTKEELLGTVLRTGFGTWAAAASQRADATPDPWTALAAFFEDALTHHAHHRAMVERFAGNWAEPAAECTEALRPVIDDLVARAHAAGALRAGVTGEDVALLLACLGPTVRMTESCGHPQLWRRLLRICLDGMRAGHPDPLPYAGSGPACGAGPVPADQP